MNIGDMDSEMLAMALEALLGMEYEEGVLPLIKGRYNVITEEICESDGDDERNRGFRAGLKWVMDLPDMIQKERKRKQSDDIEEIKSEV